MSDAKTVAESSVSAHGKVAKNKDNCHFTQDLYDMSYA